MRLNIFSEDDEHWKAHRVFVCVQEMTFDLGDLSKWEYVLCGQSLSIISDPKTLEEPEDEEEVQNVSNFSCSFNGIIDLTVEGPIQHWTWYLYLYLFSVSITLDWTTCFVSEGGNGWAKSVWNASILGD